MSVKPVVAVAAGDPAGIGPEIVLKALSDAEVYRACNPLVIAELHALGIERPRLAVAGLNPHSGEHGMFGAEEDLEIRPAVAWAREQGFNVAGPVPADSVFYQARNGRYDAVISLYHDQGHIAAKTLDFERTVSVTLGLPFIRTSVDHGTAFDIAGKGVASAVSMKEAIVMAAEYSGRLVNPAERQPGK